MPLLLTHNPPAFEKHSTFSIAQKEAYILKQPNELLNIFITLTCKISSLAKYRGTCAFTLVCNTFTISVSHCCSDAFDLPNKYEHKGEFRIHRGPAPGKLAETLHCSRRLAVDRKSALRRFHIFLFDCVG